MAKEATTMATSSGVGFFQLVKPHWVRVIEATRSKASTHTCMYTNGEESIIEA